MTTPPSSPIARPPTSLRRFTLHNGLRVVLQEDRSAPVVAVNLWYHVGSKDEKPGRTGFAHLFEHLLFQGSENVGDDQHFALIQQRGGAANGSTFYDRTNYYETLPSRELELALWLESDRLGFFLKSITQEKLDNQRDVVKNERRFRIDNQPYGTWLEKGFELLFAPGHPYRWPVIGYMPDLDAARLEDVQDFFRTYYLPNNAVLSLVGDLDLDRTEELVQTYFGVIPPGTLPPRVDHRFAPPSRERRLQVEDEVNLPRVYSLHGIPAFGTEAFYALDFASDLLSSGKSARLYRRLVQERELAKDASAFVIAMEDASVFVASATPRPGVETARLEAALDAEIEQLRREPALDSERTRALNRIEAAFIARLESAEQRADLLSMYTTYFDAPERIDTEIERYRSVTVEAVTEAMRKALDPAHRVVLTYVPKSAGRTVTGGGATGESAAASAPALARDRAPGSGAERPYRFPRPQRTRLANGLRVVASRVAKVPVVGAATILDAGSARDPRGKEGLAALTASLLDEGTPERSSTELAEALETLGAAFSAAADVDSATVGLSALTRNFPEAFAIVSEMLTGAAFPDRELLRIRAEQAASVLENRSNPGAVADEICEALCYGAHPYAHPLLGTEATVEALGRADVTAFAGTHMRPDGSVLLLAGDLDPERTLHEVERRLGAWRGPGTALASLPSPEASGAAAAAAAPAPAPAGGEKTPAASGARTRRIHLVDRPGSPQSEIRLANRALPRASADWIATEVLNGIFGGKFTSRINLNLRERHGYTYGARSGFSARVVAGPFTVATAVNAEATGPSLVELLGELDRIRDEDVTQAELDDTRSYLMGVFPLTVETSGDVLSRLAEIELFGLPDDTFETYRERIAAVSAADVRRAAVRYVRPEDMSIVVVGPAEAVRASLEALGEIVLLDDRGLPVVP